MFIGMEPKILSIEIVLPPLSQKNSPICRGKIVPQIQFYKYDMMFICYNLQVCNNLQVYSTWLEKYYGQLLICICSYIWWMLLPILNLLLLGLQNRFEDNGLKDIQHNSCQIWSHKRVITSQQFVAKVMFICNLKKLIWAFSC